MENTNDIKQKRQTSFKSRRLKRKSEDGSIIERNSGKTSPENNRPSPKLRKYCCKISTVESEKQREETDASENALLPCQSTVNVLKPSQCTTKSHNRCKDRKKPLVTRLENLNEGRESSKTAASFILSPRADRPYKCSFCSKQFKYFSNLKSHMSVVHKKMVESSPKDSKDSIVRNGQVFQCEICLRNFKYFSNLRTHRLVHTSSELDSNNSQVIV